MDFLFKIKIKFVYNNGSFESSLSYATISDNTEEYNPVAILNWNILLEDGSIYIRSGKPNLLIWINMRIKNFIDSFCEPFKLKQCN